MSFRTLNKYLPPAAIQKLDATRAQLRETFEQVAAQGTAVKHELSTRSRAFADKAVETLDPITPYQKVTPRVLGDAHEPSVQERFQALRQGLTYYAPTAPTTEKSEEDIAAVQKMNAHVSVNGGAPGFIGASPNAFKAYRELHDQNHALVIGTFASIDRIARGEHDAQAAQKSYEQIYKLIHPLEGKDVPRHVQNRAVIAAGILKAEMGGIRDIRDAGVTATVMKDFHCAFVEMKLEMRTIAKDEKQARLERTKKTLLSLADLKRDAPKAPGQGFFSRLVRGFSKAADAEYAIAKLAHDQKIEQLQRTISTPASKVSGYMDALSDVHGYYERLTQDLAEQLEQERPSLAGRVKNMAKRTYESSVVALAFDSPN